MTTVIGIDEAGRGCWAGPLVAAAVRLNEPIRGLNDSKRLSKIQRERLAVEIKQKADYGMGWVSAQEVDDLGLTLATKQAMIQAISQMEVNSDEIIIDGNYNYLADVANTNVMPKADALVPAVSAASILAKVARDSFMQTAAQKYPIYFFELHVGYGTAKHLEALKYHGPCELHRLSYKPLQALLKVADV